MNTIFKWLATALIIMITLQSEAQPSWQWGRRGGSIGSGGDEQVTDMATDQHGNVYVLAINNPYGIANVDGHTGIGIWDRVSVASWNCNGEFRWMKTFGSGVAAGAQALGVDTLGGVYITGNITSNIYSSNVAGYFDVDSVLPHTNKTAYVIKYDTAGNFKWLKMPQPVTASGNFSGFLDMDVSPGGDIYLYSRLAPGLWDEGTFTVADTGMYVWKMNKDGAFQNLTKLDITVSGTSSQGYGYGNLSPLQSHFRRDQHSGKYYICGWRNADFGTLTMGTIPVEGAMYISAFSKNGTALWTKLQDSTGHNIGIETRAVVDTFGDIYISGGGAPGGSFGGHVFTNFFGGHGIPILIALDSNGNMKWATNGHAKSLTTVKAATLANGIIALASRQGYLQWQDLIVSSTPGISYIYLARFFAGSGTILSLNSLKTNSLNNGATAITADKSDNLYLGGKFESALFVATDTLLRIGGTYDWFVAKFGTANCNCTLATPNFTYSTSGNAIHFSYTGSTDYTSISWDFGDSTTSALSNPSHTFSDTGMHTVCVTVINDCGSNVYCMEVQAPTGIESTAIAAGVKVYPNPATNSIMIEGAGSGTKLLLYDVTGTLALEQTLRSSLPVSLNISHLPDGVYLLQFTDGKGKRGMTKVVKR